MGICSIVVLILRKKTYGRMLKYKESESEIIDILFLVLFLIINILAYSANYLGTDVVSVFSEHRDMQYWTNNTVSLKLSWPPDKLFFQGDTLYYHYFSSIVLAFLSEAYGIDVFTISYPLYSLTKAIVLTGSVLFFLDTVKANRKMTFFGYVLILCTTGLETVAIATYFHHMILSPFGFDLGYAYGLIFVSLLIRQWSIESFNLEIFVLTLLIWIMCIGSKAPIAMILILIPALICYYWLIKRKWGMAFGYGLTILFLFLIICTSCAGMFTVLNGDADAWVLKFRGVSSIKDLHAPEAWDKLGQWLVIIGRHSIAIAILMRWIFVNPAAVLGAFLSIILTIKKIYARESSGILQIIFALCALWGLMLGVVVRIGGYSEMYFSMAALIPMYFMIYNSTVSENLNLGRGGKTALTISQVAIALLLVVGVYRFSMSTYDQIGAYTSSKQGLKNIYAAMVGNEPSYSSRLGIRKSDVEALKWMQDNTDKDSLIMTDKAIMTENASYYMYGIFCERQQYIEGTDMLNLANEDKAAEIERRKKLVRNVYINAEGALEMAREEGIDYIVQTIDITTDFEYDENLLELVVSTETMNVYKVK